MGWTGRILLKGDNITLMQTTCAPSMLHTVAHMHAASFHSCWCLWTVFVLPAEGGRSQRGGTWLLEQRASERGACNPLQAFGSVSTTAALWRQEC